MLVKDAVNFDNQRSEDVVHLNSAQMKSIESGQPVGLLIGGTECVVLRKDVFDRMLRSAEDEWTEAEFRAVAARTVFDADLEESIVILMPHSDSDPLSAGNTPQG